MIQSIRLSNIVCSSRSNKVMKDKLIREKHHMIKSKENLHTIFCHKLNHVNNYVTNEFDPKKCNYITPMDSLRDLAMIAKDLQRLKDKIEMYEDEEYLDNLIFLTEFVEDNNLDL